MSSGHFESDTCHFLIRPDIVYNNVFYRKIRSVPTYSTANEISTKLLNNFESDTTWPSYKSVTSVKVLTSF